MNTHKFFQAFNSEIKLSDAKIDELKRNRKALRGKIREHFEAKKWPIPYFYSQGSFPLDTNLNPIKKTDNEGNTIESYDLDDGVYFRCSESDRKTVETYHSRVFHAVEDHAKNTVDKNTCVRVEYANGHNIDLPCYWIDNDGCAPQLAHKSKGFTASDPKEFADWVNSHISDAGNNGQLRKIVRYIKAWVDWREHNNSGIRLPSGFVWTILACIHYVGDERDDIAFHKTMKAIHASLQREFACYRPTTPLGEELLASKYDSNVVLPALVKLLDAASKAIDSDCEKEASEYWQKVFGDRFPTGKKSPGPGRHIGAAGSVTIPTVAATKPYLSMQPRQHKPADTPTMVYSEVDFQEIVQFFPCLKYDEQKGQIAGSMEFCAKYAKRKDGAWEISAAQPESDKESFYGNYTIRIDLKHQHPQPKVYEISNNIRSTADRLGLRMIELHINADGSFCLDYISSITPLGITLSQFILNKVYPFLAWQAYRDKFGKKPPVGDHPHDGTELQIFLQDIRKYPRNAQCFCGSGKKHKHCCFTRMRRL